MVYYSVLHNHCFWTTWPNIETRKSHLFAQMLYYYALANYNNHCRETVSNRSGTLLHMLLSELLIYVINTPLLLSLR